MKQLRTAGVLVSLGVLAAGTALSSSAASAENLIYSSAIPARHPMHTAGLEPYFEKVTKATDGTLTFELFPGGTLSSAKTTLNAISTGTVDMGLLADVYNPNDLPVSALVSDLAVLGKDARVMSGAASEMLYLDCPACKEDYVEEDVLPLATYSLTPYHFMCTEGNKIVSIEDIEGKKIRATGAMGQLVAGLGGTPVNITSSEMYQAAQRGQVDCIMGPVPWLRSYTIWDLVVNVTDVGMGTYHGTNFININTDSWQELTEEQQDAMTNYLASAVREITQAYVTDAVEVKKKAQEMGIEWIPVDEGFHDAIEEYRTHNVERVIETAKSRGVEDPKPIVEKFTENVQKWTKIVNEIGSGEWGPEEWDAYEAKLKTEIFGKVEYP